MAYVINLPGSVPSGSFNIALKVFWSNFYDEPYTQTLLSFGEITIGEDDDSDLVLFPASFDIRFRINDEGDQERWYNTLTDFYFQTIQVEFFFTPTGQYGNYIYRGGIDKKTLKGNKDLKTIQFKTVGEIVNLNSVDPRTNPFNYANLSDKRKIKDIITDIVTHNSIITSVSGTSNLEVKVDEISSIKTFEDFGAALETYFNNNCYFDNCLDLLKNILLNYNMIGYAGLDRVFRLIPRMYESNSIYQITKNDLMDYIEFDFIEAIQGAEIKLYTGTVPQSNESNWSTKTKGDITADKVERFRLIQPGGYYTSTEGWSGVFVYHSGQWYFTDPDGQFRIKKFDNTYTDWDYLWKYPVDSVWDMVKLNRLKAKVTVGGLFTKWHFGNFYKLPGIDKIFRCSKIGYDFIKDKTKLYLRGVESV